MHSMEDKQLTMAEKHELIERIKRHHILRLQKNECTIELGFVLNDLITKGKTTHKLSAKEVGDVLEALDLTNDEMDKFYEQLETHNIELTGDNMMISLEDLAPEVSELENIEEITEEDIATQDMTVYAVWDY